MDRRVLHRRLDRVIGLLEDHIIETERGTGRGEGFAGGYLAALMDVEAALGDAIPNDRWQVWRRATNESAQVTKLSAIPQVQAISEPAPKLVGPELPILHIGGHNGVDMYVIEPDPDQPDAFRVRFVVPERIETLTGLPSVVEANGEARRKLRSLQIIP